MDNEARSGYLLLPLCNQYYFLLIFISLFLLLFLFVLLLLLLFLFFSFFFCFFFFFCFIGSPVPILFHHHLPFVVLFVANYLSIIITVQCSLNITKYSRRCFGIVGLR